MEAGFICFSAYFWFMCGTFQVFLLITQMMKDSQLFSVLAMKDMMELSTFY